MNKKILIILAIIILLAIVIFQFSLKDNNTEENLPSSPAITDDKNAVEVTDATQIEKIKNDSYLNILLQIKTFDNLNISYEPLLEAAMRIAGELNLYQVPDNGVYVEYVPRNVVHELIYELSGIRIEAPIIIEDFYYLYDEAGDYYYIVPIGSDWLELDTLSSIHYTSTSDNYIIKCSATNLTDYAIKTNYPDVEVRLKYKASNNYIKYQLISINAGKSELEVLTPDDSSSGEHENF
ncbi:MAG: hypothetical protein J6C46_10780 [Clostridia bacterium]|nr:hypothetical protein [Clostridia bacterium]